MITDDRFVVATVVKFDDQKLTAEGRSYGFCKLDSDASRGFYFETNGYRPPVTLSGQVCHDVICSLMMNRFDVIRRGNLETVKIVCTLGQNKRGPCVATWCFLDDWEREQSTPSDRVAEQRRAAEEVTRRVRNNPPSHAAAVQCGWTMVQQSGRQVILAHPEDNKRRRTFYLPPTRGRQISQRARRLAMA